MASQIVFDFIGRGAPALSRDFRSTGDSAAAAARGAAVLQKVISDLGQKENRTAAESKLLASALRRTGDEEDRAAAKALAADIAIRKLDDAIKANERDALEAAAANRVLGDSFGKLAEKAGGPSLKGALAALSPALIPVTGGIAAGIGAIGVSFGAAAIGAGLFGVLVKSVFANVSKDNQKYQTAQKQLAAAEIARSQATTKAQRASADKQIKAAQDTIASIRSEGAAYNQVLDLSKEISVKWKTASAQIASPALVPWLTAVSKGIVFIRPLVQPVADQFRSWGEAVDRYFGSSAGSAEITRLAAAFGRFSASQLRDIGIFVVDIGHGVFNLGRDLAGHNVDFGTFGTHLDQWGGAFLRWSDSAAARHDVTALLEYLRRNGLVVSGLLKNVGGDLAVLTPGLSSAGQLELRLVSDFLGFLARTPQAVAKPLIDTAGALLLLQKTGTLKVGLKIAGPALKWLTGGVINIGGGATAGAEIRAAMVSGGTAAAAEIRAAMTTGGLAGIGKTLPVAGPVAAVGGAEAGAGAAPLATLLGPVVIGAVAGIAIALWADQFRSTEHAAPKAQQGPRGYFSPKPGDINAWKQYDGLVRQASGAVAGFIGKPLLPTFDRQGKAAQAAGTDLGHYGDVITAAGLSSSRTAPARQKLIADLIAAGVNAKTARADVAAYGSAVQRNGAQSEQAHAARYKLAADISNAAGNAQRGRQDMASFTSAVKNNSASSDAVRTARQHLIADLIAAGTDAKTARADVNNLQAAINVMHGKGISISMSGKGYYSISEAGKNYQISAGGLFSPHAAGGFISGGTPGKDSVFGVLMPGEVVVPVSMVKAGAVDHLRGMLPGFAAGGAAGPVPAGEAGIGRFYKADVNDEGYSLVSAMRKALKASEAAARAAIAASQAAGTGSRVTASGARTGSVAVEQAYAFSLFPAHGWGASQRAPLIALWNQESGWNPYAVNPKSGAYGIPQSLGHGHPYNLGDYKAQIQWGENYIKTRPGYGTPAAAWAHEVAFNWYGKGGMVPGYASGGSVAQQGAAWLKAWRSRHGGGYGAAWGPVVVNEQIARMTAAAARAATLAGAHGLTAAQHRYWTAKAADEKKRLAVLRREVTTERAWRTMLGASDTTLARQIAAAGSSKSLAGPVRGWKAQMARQKSAIAGISRMLGYSGAYLAAHKAAGTPGTPKPSGPPLPGITHTYGGDVADTLGAVLASALGPFTGAARGGLVMDRGGWLKPGWNPPMYNGTGRPEPIVPDGRGGGGGWDGVVRLEIAGSDQELVTLIRKIVKVKGGGSVERAFGSR